MTSNWETALLGEICTLTKGKSPTLKTLPGEYPLMVTGPVPRSSESYDFVGEAVCIPMVSSTGHGHASLKRVHYATGRFAAANILTVAELKDPDRHSTKYLYYFLQHFKDELVVSRMKGTANVSLSQKELAKVPVRLPSLIEQRRIVDLIGALDEAIEATEGQAESSQRLLQQRRDALIGTGAAVAVPAAAAFEITIGRQRSPKHEQGDGMTPYLRSANIKPGSLLLDDVKIMNFSDREIEKYHLQPGDVLVTEGSGSPETVGAPAQWNNELASPVCFQNTLLRYRAINDVTIPDYVYHWCQWAFESRKFLDIASGTNIKHIGSTRAIKVPVQLHSLERQNEICDELEALENVAVSTAETEAALRTLRSEMLTSLLSRAHTIPASYDELLKTVDA